MATVVALTVSLVAAACSAPAPDDPRPVVAVSVAPIAYWVERLAEDAVRVEVLVPAGASPATFEPTMQQIRAVSRARLFVRVAHPHFPFERAWLAGLLAEAPQAEVVDCWKPEGNAAEEHEEDPHVWLSTETARDVVVRLAAALTRTLPGRADRIEHNRDALLGDIRTKDAAIADIFEAVVGRRFYVFHPAWGHFADRYGLEQIAVEDHGKEPDPSTLARLIEKARGDGVTAVFVQPQFSKASAEVVAGEIGAELVVIDPLARDWLENLSAVAETLAPRLVADLGAPR